MNIDNKYFNKKGFLNSSKLKEEWIKKNDNVFYNNIITFNKGNNELSFLEKLYLYINNTKLVFLCLTCEKKSKFLSVGRGYQKYCSDKCAQNNKIHKNILLYKRSITSILRYSFSNPLKNPNINNKMKFIYNQFSIEKKRNIKEKQKKTSLQKYGVEYITQTESFKKRLKTTCIKKYGVEYITQTERHIENNKRKRKQLTKEEKKIILGKKKQTSLLKYGTYYPMQSNKIKEKFKNSVNYKNYNKYVKIINEYLITDINYHQYIQKGIKAKYTFICKKCKKSFIDYLSYNGLPKCIYCYPINRTNIEIDIENYIKNLIIDISILSNDKILLNGKELDIYLPNKNLAIEYNGLMFHSIGKHKSSMFNNYELELEIKNKHLWKTEECKKQGIQLLHIFENEWLNPIKQDIWKNIIKNKMGTNNNKIFARKTTIKELSNEKCKGFLNMYHLQGNIASKLKIGLFNKEGELLQLMTFGKSRFDKNIDWEILRFATKNGNIIVGGASKIFSYFKKNYLENGQSIKTYADLRFSNGNIYNKLGFEQIGQSKPNYFYFKNGSLELESRQKYQKHKLKDKLDNFDPNLTESENMYNNGYRKIYDCGNLVFIYQKDEK